MFNDSRIVLPKLAKPVSFASLMALYESNYLRVLAFLDLRREELCGQEFLWANSDYCIHIIVEQVTKYTALLAIDEDLFEQGEPVRMNHFRVRLYHDAQLATVHSSLHASDHYNLDDLPIDQNRIADLWQQNMFFNKWLEYCSDRQLKLLEK